MPTLHWIGKEKVVNHHQDVPYRVLEHQYGFDAEKGEHQEPTESGNKIIHGDNLEALKSLLPEYEGKIKCIYIDPPYNTGNENWVYNDNVNHPKIKKWLGEVVGKEGDDLSRHDKWLCMMYPRLKLLHKLLADDGAIFVSIDDNEQANLKLLLDEIFGIGNFMSTIIWEKSDSPKMDSKTLSNKHDFILLYSKNYDSVSINQVEVDSEKLSHYNKVDDDGKRYYLKPLRAMGGQGETREARPNLYYPITAPDGTKVFPKLKDGTDGAWRWSREKLEKDIHLIEWTNSKDSWNPNYKIFAEDNNKRPAETIWYNENVGSNRTSRAEIVSIFKRSNSFNTPKPINLIKKVIELSTRENDLILDSFAGSGTTAHAVQNLNAEDGGNRKFILVEMEDYANSITAERVKRVMKGYGKGKKRTEGTGGSFNYYRLGQPLFDENDLLNEEIDESRIREYVWYSETKSPLLRGDLGMCKTDDKAKALYHYLGTKDETDYYFFYEKEAITTLNHDFLATIKQKAHQYVIYADNCLLSKEFLQSRNIIFKKIPRDISRF